MNTIRHSLLFYAYTDNHLGKAKCRTEQLNLGEINRLNYTK